MKIRDVAVFASVGLVTAASGQYSVTAAQGRIDLFRTGLPPETVQSSNVNGYLLEDIQTGLARAMFTRTPGRLLVEAFGRGFVDVPNQRDFAGEGSSTVRFNTSVGYYLRLTKSETTVPLSPNRTTAKVFIGDSNVEVTQNGFLPAGTYRAVVGAVGGAEGISATARLDLGFSQGNTICTQAIAIGVGTFTGTTVGAIPDGGAAASCGASTGSPAVWYRFTAPRTGTINISTCGSSYDTVLSVYASTSCPVLGQQIACDDDGGGARCSLRDSRVSVPVTANSIYYIRVSGFSGATGDYVLHVGPDNDNCAYATTMTASGLYPIDTNFASTDGGTLPGGACSNGGLDPQVNNEVWFRFDAPVNGYFAVQTCGQAAWDTKLAAYDGEACLGDGEFIDCNDDSCGLQSALGANAWADAPIYIRVGGYLGARGTGNIEFTWVPACPPDFNNDGFTDFFDYDAYVLCFETGDCPRARTADFNGDGFADFFDYDSFVEAFETGGC